MKIEIAIHCYNFQKRLNWMLSSIVQQELSSCELEISIAYTPKNGDPTTESVIDYYSKQKQLSIINIVLDKYQILRRAVSRNDRVKNTSADWIVFVDADMVYHPQFFESVAQNLKTEFKNETRVIGADRFSLDIEYCTNAFNIYKSKPVTEINNVYNLVKKWPLSYIAHGRRAAGYFQLVNVDVLKDKTKVYSTATFLDNILTSNYPSDQFFRRRIGGRVKMKTLPQYHLNHNRNTQEQK